MTQSTSIPKSKQGIVTTIWAIGIGAGFILLLVLFMIQVLFGWTTNTKQFLTVLAIVIILGGWAFASLAAWLRWKSTRYEMDNKAIIVHAKGMFFESTRTEYFYSTLSRAHVRRTFLSKFADFGDVVLVDGNGNKLVTLSGVSEPTLRFEQISAHIKN